MKTRPYLILTSIALTSTLLASPPVMRLTELERLLENPPKKDHSGGCHVIDNQVRRPPVKKLKEMTANEESIQSIINNDKAKETVDKLNAPIVIDSMKDALKHLTRASMEKIEVDFDKEQLAIFAWQGSERDMLSGELHTNHGVVAKFNYSRRRTGGMKTHSVIFSMPKRAKIEAVELGTGVKRCGNGGVKPIDPKQIPGGGLQLAPVPQGVQAQPKPAPAKKRIAPSIRINAMEEVEANGDAIESILKNEKLKTTLDKLNAPIVIRSMEDAQKYLTRDSMEKIGVDFDTHEIVIFVWQGSGEDWLRGRLRDEGRTGRFIHKKGNTEDLRTHTAVYTLPKNARVSVADFDEARALLDQAAGLQQAVPGPPVKPMPQKRVCD